MKGLELPRHGEFLKGICFGRSTTRLDKGKRVAFTGVNCPASTKTLAEEAVASRLSKVSIPNKGRTSTMKQIRTR